MTKLSEKTFLVLSMMMSFIVLSGCSSVSVNMPNNTDLLAEITGQNGRACVRASDIRGYGTLDDDVISIDSRRR